MTDNPTEFYYGTWGVIILMLGVLYWLLKNTDYNDEDFNEIL